VIAAAFSRDRDDLPSFFALAWIYESGPVELFVCPKTLTAPSGFTFVFLMLPGISNRKSVPFPMTVQAIFCRMKQFLTALSLLFHSGLFFDLSSQRVGTTSFFGVMTQSSLASIT